MTLRKQLSLTIGLLTMVILAGCWFGGKSTLTVHVVNLESKPIIATVTLKKAVDKTMVGTADGSTAIFMDLGRGKYTLTAVSELGTTTTEEISVEKAVENLTVKIGENTTTLLSNLTINVMDKYEHPAVATVQLINVRTRQLIGIQTGKTVTFAQVPVGAYQIIATLANTGDVVKGTYNLVKMEEAITVSFSAFSSVDSVEKRIFAENESKQLTISNLGSNERVIMGVSILDFEAVNGDFDSSFTDLDVKLQRVPAGFGRGAVVPFSGANRKYVYRSAHVSTRSTKVKSIDLQKRVQEKEVLRRIAGMPKGLISVQSLSPALPQFPGQYSVNDKRTFWFQNIENYKWKQITTTLVASGQRCNIFLDDTVKYVDKAMISRIIGEFDSKIFPTNTNFFAPGFDIDGNGKLGIVLLNMGMQNFDGGVVMGFFTGLDYFDQNSLDEMFGAGYYTNQGDYVYLNTQTLDSELALGFTETDLLSTVAHEFQHEIFWHNTWKDGYLWKTPAEGYVDDTWINEAMATYAEKLNGYITGVDDRVYIYFDDADVISQLTQLTDTSQVSLTYWGDEVANYGMAGLFLTYLVEQFGQEIIHDVYGQAQNPILTISEIAGLPFERIFLNWTIANKLHSLNLAPEYSYELPLEGDPSHSLLATNYQAESYFFRKGAVKYYLIEGNGTDVQLKIQGAEGKKVGVFTYRY